MKVDIWVIFFHHVYSLRSTWLATLNYTGGVYTCYLLRQKWTLCSFITINRTIRHNTGSDTWDYWSRGICSQQISERDLVYGSQHAINRYTQPTLGMWGTNRLWSACGTDSTTDVSVALRKIRMRLVRTGPYVIVSNWPMADLPVILLPDNTYVHLSSAPL